MTQPTGDEVANFTGAIETLLHWGPIPAIVAFGAYVWRISAKYANFESTHEKHAERIADHEKRLDKLDIATTALAVSLAGQPTRADIDRLRDEARADNIALKTQMQDGFDNIIQILARRN